MDATLDTIPQRPGAAVDFARLASGLWRSRGWLLLALLVGCICSYSLLQVALAPDYQAEAAIVWDPTDIREAAAQHRKLRTFAASVELPETLSEVRQRLNLDLSIDDMAEAIVADVRANSNLLRLYVRSTDPELAANLANEVVAVFIEQQRVALRLQVKEIVDSTIVVRDAALAELRTARAAYDAFREKEGILDLRAERTAAIEKAAILQTTADHARADLAAEIERVRVLNQAKKRVGQTVVISETESAPAAIALAEARAELEQLRGVLTEEHPRVQSLAAQIKTLEQTLDSTLKPVVGTRIVARHPQRDRIENGLVDAQAARDAASKRERTYQEMMTSTKVELAELIRLEGKASALITVLELAEKRYADAEAAVGRAHDIARTRTTGLRPASPATKPLGPVPGRRRLVVAAAVPVLFLLAVIAALLVFSLRALRVSSSREIAFWSDAPVVAMSPWPSGEHSSEELCDEFLVDLRGRTDSTLIVPYSAAEAEPANQLYEALRTRLHGKPHDGQSKKPIDPSKNQSGRLDDRTPTIELWRADGPSSLRRACRHVTRILVVINIRRHSHFSVYGLKTRLGRADGVGLAVIGVAREVARMPDRVGDVESFWSDGGRADQKNS